MTHFRSFPIVIATIAVALTSSGLLQSQTEVRTPEKTFMRLKLDPAKQILEGIATENYDMIVINAQRIQTLTLDEKWNLSQSERYIRNSDEFQRTVKAITDAAREKNLDGATLAYTKMTFSCVGCHRDLRRDKQAQKE